MRTHQTLFGIGITLALTGCGASMQQRPAEAQVSRASCAGMTDVDRHVAELYTPGNVQKVEAVYESRRASEGKRFRVRADYPRNQLVGAELYVPAQPGMTGPYLERALSCHAASSAAGTHPNDPLKVAGVDDVDVDVIGPGFRIAITGKDRAASAEIWQRARAFDPQTQVEVRQLSAVTPSNGAL